MQKEGQKYEGFSFYVELDKLLKNSNPAPFQD
jgi:hypothetical protein